MKQIYLSGPIDGLNYSEATSWRNYVSDTFARYTGIVCHDPMRQRTYKTSTDIVSADRPLADVVVTLDESMNTDRGITLRDYHDTINSDLLFVNLHGARKVSIGTVIEIAWAWERRIPIIVVMEPTGNPHEHPMIREQISYRVHDLSRAIQVAVSVLNTEPR
jgi:hypothetical protein